MSDNIVDIIKLQQQAQASAQAQKETVNKRVEQARKEGKLQELRTERMLREEEIRRESTLDTVTPVTVPTGQDLLVRNRYLREQAKQTPALQLEFLSKQMSELLPHYSGQLIGVGAFSGQGKTTTLAAAGHYYWKQKKKALFFSAEERSHLIYARILQCDTGVDANKIGNFPEQLTMQEEAEIAAVEADLYQYVTVIGMDVVGQNGQVSSKWLQTLDGFQRVWKDANPTQYDVILIDYFQKISEDTRNQQAAECQILFKLSNFLDSEKNAAGMPPIILAMQLKSSDETNENSVKNRIEYCKAIYNVCTEFIEVVANNQQYETSLMFWKRRFATDYARLNFGFDKVRKVLVPLDDAFRMKRDWWIQQRMKQQMTIQHGPVVSQIAQIPAEETAPKQENADGPKEA